MRRAVETAVLGALFLAAWAHLIAGILLGSAAYLPGTSIEQYEPIRWAELPREIGRLSWAAVWPYFPWLIGPLFILTQAAAVAARAGVSESSRQLRTAVRVVLLAGILPAALGALSLVFTVLDAARLDGEYLNEFHPVREAYCLAYIGATWSYCRARRRPRTIAVMMGSLGVGGLGLVLLASFVLFGPPFFFPIAGSDHARLVLDGLLCLGFFLQHSGMIRRGFKRGAARWIGPVYQPAVYSIASGAALILLFVFWQPTREVRLLGWARWASVPVAALALAGFAWGVRSLRGFDPFGTSPLRAALRGTSVQSVPFVTRGPYRFVRHPLYAFLLVFIWSAPRLSADQLLFNVLWTAWTVVGTKLEERDLVADLGQAYREYQLSVPMLVPWRRVDPDRARAAPAA